MEATTRHPELSEKTSTGRVLRAGLLAASFSGAANALVLLVASALFGSIAVPLGEPLTLGPVVVASAVGAAIALAVMGQLVRRPIRVFRIIAVVVLLLSFLTIVLLGVAGPSAGVLILMHVVSAAIVVGLLTSHRSAGGNGVVRLLWPREGGATASFIEGGANKGAAKGV